MNTYLYSFGYKSLDDILDVTCDSESCGRIFIEAETEAMALEWGNEISKWYVDRINSGCALGPWKSSDFANWIEIIGRRDSMDCDQGISTVRIGEYPCLDGNNEFIKSLNQKSAQQVDSAEASTIAVPPSNPSGSPR